MSDTDTPAPEGAPDDPTPTDPDTETVDLEAEVNKWKELARKHERRAKDNATAAKELEEFRKQAMSDTERAIAEAREAGMAEATKAFGGKLAAAEIRAAAAGRLDDNQLATLLDVTDTTRFLGDDGEVDVERVRSFVDGIAPVKGDAPSFPDLGQGARGASQMALNGDELEAALRKAVGA